MVSIGINILVSLLAFIGGFVIRSIKADMVQTRRQIIDLYDECAEINHKLDTLIGEHHGRDCKTKRR